MDNITQLFKMEPSNGHDKIQMKQHAKSFSKLQKITSKYIQMRVNFNASSSLQEMNRVVIIRMNNNLKQ